MQLTAKKIYLADFLRLTLTRPFLVLFLGLSTIGSGSHASDSLEVMLGTDLYQLELARTVAERRRGLMHRPHLGSRQGMLFVYPKPGDYRIWMKNTLIPLRVYWIDAELIVIDVQRLEPCTQSPCPIYSVNRDSHYILELSDREHPLAVGDKLTGIGAAIDG